MGVGWLLWGVAAAAPAAPPVSAAPENPQTIIVTGERTKRTVKETPSSVVVFTRREIDKMAAPDRVQDLLAFVPNVLVPTSRDAPVIRGQSAVGVLSALPAFLGGARPRTAMQVDGRTVTFNELVNSTEGLWDVDRVEVFRTPQTTTQGVNSIAGAIFIHTADPTFDGQGRARLIVGKWHRRQASAAVSMPVVGDQLAFRVSGDVYQAHSSTTMEGPTVGISNLNVDHYWTARAKLLAQPRGVPALKVLTTFAHTHSQAPQAEVARPPLRERRDGNYRFGYFKSDVDSVTSTISYDAAGGLESRTTVSRGWSHFRRFSPEGYGQTQIHARDAAAETVLEWKPDGPVSAVGGMSFQQVDLGQFIDLAAAGLGTGSFDDKQKSIGLFGELSWHPAERVSLTAGARYQSDGKRRVGVLRMGPDLPLDYDKTTHAFLPKLSAAYDVTKDVRVGLLVQRAYNPGGTTLDAQNRKQLDFKPEYLWDFEAFTRASMFGGRASLNANFFYNRIRDAQRELDFDFSSPAGPVGLLQILSEPKSRSYGAELELNAHPTQRLTLNLGAGFLNTKITRGSVPNDPYVRKKFFGAPPFTAAGGADWEPLSNVHLSTQARHESGFAGDDSDTDLFNTKGFWIVDARASWGVKKTTLFAYARNLFNTFQVIGYTGPRNDPFLEVELTDPREVGIGIESRF